jgi:DNA helicase-2/ATP-dependent DNA helicase PcrA
VFHHVEDKLKAENLGTYSHIITRALELLRDPEQAGHLERAGQGARFLLVDEFQDSNVAQIELARILAGPSANVFAVGDPDQAIYRFRGATTGTFDHFLRTFGVDNVQRVTMPDNRRSTEPVLQAAYLVISQNPDISSVELPGGEKWRRTPLVHKRTKKEPEPVSPVLVRGWATGEDEAACVADEIARLRAQDGREWNDFAVIYHNHKHRNEVVWEFTRRGIPFLVKGLDLLETPEVRDLMASLLAMQGEDSVALLRVAALASFAVDGSALRAALQAQGENSNLESALEAVPGGLQVVTALKEARSDLKRAGEKAVAACEIAIRRFGIARADDTDGFLEFVKSWSRKPRQVSGDGTLSEFLEYLQYFMEAGGCIARPEDEDGEKTPAALQMEMGQTASAGHAGGVVQLLTAHAAKGLEFPVVFVLRLTNPSFPARYREELVEFPNAMRDPDSRLEEDPKQIHVEEERRLFYVAVTRAEDVLYLCAKKGTGKVETPPGYLRELIKAANKGAPGCVEFGLVPSVPALPPSSAGSQLASRIRQWVDLPPRPETLRHKLSAGAIDEYERCPLKYKLSLEWNLKEEPTANIHFGWAMHAALYAHFDALHKGRPMAAEEVVKYFREEFGGKPIADATQRRLYEADGERQLRAFLASPAAQPLGKVALLEHWFRCEVAGAQVVGRIDRVDEDEDGYVVIDYKTGRPKSQDTADDSVQLSLYALALSAKKPVKLLVFQNLEDNSSVVTTRSADELRATETKVAAVAAGIAAGNFAADPGRHCAWCAYRSICPAQEVNLPRGIGENAAG